jgi:hypothetical protein
MPPRCGSCILHGGFNFCGHSGRNSIDKDDYLSAQCPFRTHSWSTARACGWCRPIYIYIL